MSAPSFISNAPETSVYHGLSPAEAGLLADLIRAARRADHPDRYAPVTIAERDALITQVPRLGANRSDGTDSDGRT